MSVIDLMDEAYGIKDGRNDGSRGTPSSLNALHRDCAAAAAAAAAAGLLGIF